MAIVKAVLFEELEFQATRDNFTRLKQTNHVSFAPFVKRVFIMPNLYGAILNSSGFQNIHLNIADHHQRLEDLEGDAVREAELVREYLQGDSHRIVFVINGEDEMKDAYQKYKECAQKDLELMLEESLHDVWLECFQSFQRLTSMSVHSLLSRHPFIPAWDSLVVANSLDVCLECVRCMEILTRDFISERSLVAQTVVPCMGAANTTLEVLSVDWAILVILGRGWRERECQLPPFARLAELRMYSPSDDVHAECNVDVDTELNWRMGVETLLDKTHTTLQHLEVFGTQEEPELEWVSMSRLSFPCLRHLEVSNVWTNLESLAADISHFSGLEQLVVEGVEIMTRREGDWKPVFDALRDHQTRMSLISFLNIRRMDDTTWTIDIRDYELESYYAREEMYSYPEPMASSLRGYLTKRGGWDGPLEEWFPRTAQ
ncbi:hypothetical protein A1O7_03866 [Cladophialophora yegresii CBS 114405]|uniref:Uncharacterized protein n=1 Tax=Cladophialophora yegresii CBS 114405 TaxID=1182544 RepID=W9W3Y8_9EURO|nr:uncharacterized protein A1O7_03866 [Cladophialophora yegresii CBS 114405]EXJ59720.1 hypothetical protein A1O7_03866 [Cladophialophora yegresii CBS 114405]